MSTQTETEESMRSSGFAKISSSRILKFATLIIFLLSTLYLISTLIISFLTYYSIKQGVSKEVEELLVKISEFIHIDVSAAIGTLATAVVARYGLREITSNLSTKSNSTINSNANSTETKQCR